MISARERPTQKRASIIAAVSLTGLLWFLSTGPHPIAPLAWVAPLPLLLVLPSLTGWRSALAGFVAWMIGALNVIAAYPRLPATLLASAVLLLALPGAGIGWGWSRIARRSGPLGAALGYAALVVVAEYALSQVSPHGTFGSVAYSQANVLPVVQLASLAGTSGITFIVSLIPAVLAVIWLNRGERRNVTAVAVTAIAITGAAVGWGGWRLATGAQRDLVNVGLATSDTAAIHFEATSAPEALSVISQYASRIERLAGQGARVIVLPEKFVGIAPDYADSVRRFMSSVARRHNVTIVAGLNTLDSGGVVRRNLAVVFDSAGRIPLAYAKVHLIGGLEAEFRPGSGPGLLGDSVTGVAICKDLDFPGFMRGYARAGRGLLLVPAWDFTRDAWLHSRMAIMRGVEGGYSVVRTATNGRLTVSDAYGRIVAERSSSDAPEVLVTAMAPTSPIRTMYGRAGDWFVLVCLALVVVAASVRRRPAVTPGRPR